MGRLITFEGIEGCGKSTHASLLAEYLESRGLKVLVTREPGGTRISEAIRNILLSPDLREMHPYTEVLLYLASRAQHVYELVLPSLQQGMIVISDRFSDSTLVYQGYVREINISIIEAMNKFATGGLVPDITFLLDVSPEEGLRRARSRNKKELRGEDRIEQEDIEFHAKVRTEYIELARRFPERIHVIKANREVKEVQGDIRRIVDREIFY